MDARPDPRMDTCPPSLPAGAYRDPTWLAREERAIWRRSWVCVGRLGDHPPGTMRPVTVGGAPVVLIRPEAGPPAAFHNVCPHRGSELCAEERPVGRLVACPYHAFAFDARDGRLVATGRARPSPDLDRATMGLLPVALREWGGFLFLNLEAEPGPLEADLPLATLANWPLENLAPGHEAVMDLRANWKLFWENYSECLHCPNLHPALCERVPVYRQGVMAPEEAPGWEGPAISGESWTPDGALCAPAFPGLSAKERAAGHLYLTFWPTMFVVAHADHVRAVRVEPLGPERTRLTATWLFDRAALAGGLDAGAVAAFAMQVLREDGEAVEMNQRGLASPAFARGRLMPEEHELFRFQSWVLKMLEETP